MTRETKPYLKEQRTPKEPNERICEQDDSNLEQDQPIKTTNDLESDDERNKCVTSETEETKRHRRRHSAPQGTSIRRCVTSNEMDPAGRQVIILRPCQ